MDMLKQDLNSRFKTLSLSSWKTSTPDLALCVYDTLALPSDVEPSAFSWTGETRGSWIVGKIGGISRPLTEHQRRNHMDFVKTKLKRWYCTKGSEPVFSSWKRSTSENVMRSLSSVYTPVPASSRATVLSVVKSTRFPTVDFSCWFGWLVNPVGLIREEMLYESDCLGTVVVCRRLTRPFSSSKEIDEPKVTLRALSCEWDWGANRVWWLGPPKSPVNRTNNHEYFWKMTKKNLD